MWDVNFDHKVVFANIIKVISFHDDIYKLFPIIWSNNLDDSLIKSEFLEVISIHYNKFEQLIAEIDKLINLNANSLSFQQSEQEMKCMLF